MNIQIVFRQQDWERLRKYLSKRQDVESGSYAVFKTSGTERIKKFLVKQVVIPDERDYLRRSARAVAFRPEFTEKCFQLCEQFHGHLLDIHTHPWSTDVQFSPIDDREATCTKVPYMRKYLPETMIAFIVLGESIERARARFWDKEREQLSYIPRIIVI